MVILFFFYFFRHDYSFLLWHFATYLTHYFSASGWTFFSFFLFLLQTWHENPERIYITRHGRSLGDFIHRKRNQMKGGNFIKAMWVGERREFYGRGKS